MTDRNRIMVAPEHLDSLEAMCKKFGKGRRTIKKWKSLGAPIGLDGGKYCAEYNALMAWLVGQGAEKKPPVTSR